MELNTRIKNYWEGEAQVYSDYIQDELVGFESKVWCELLLEYAPDKASLDVLDIGTGPGFFPIILSKAGLVVTGIDLTENMIELARQNLEREGGKATLMTMDCQDLRFSDNSFDLLVCRNLTWTLDDPAKAYQQWHRVLRPDGRLLVFDACWYLHLFDEDMKKEYNKKEEAMLMKYGRSIHQHKDQAEGDALSTKLFMSDKIRPQWDLDTMLKIGFSKVFADTTIGERTQDEKQRDIGSMHPPFLVGGVK